MDQTEDHPKKDLYADTGWSYLKKETKVVKNEEEPTLKKDSKTLLFFQKTPLFLFQKMKKLFFFLFF